MTGTSSSWARRWEERWQHRSPDDLTAYWPLYLMVIIVIAGGSMLVGLKPTLWSLAGFFALLTISYSIRSLRWFAHIVRHYFPFIAHPAIKSDEDRAAHSRFAAIVLAAAGFVLGG